MIRPELLAAPPGAGTAEQSAADDAELRRCVERIVRRRRGGRARVVALQRRRQDDGSSYAAEIVTARLAGGAELQLFVKDFGSSPRFVKDQPRQQRDRELRVYRELLADAGLGTATYYGSEWDESRGRFWLFLAFVPGTPLAYCGIESWIAAAAWLGRLHGHFAGRAEHVRACDFLLRHDADFFRATARRAAAAVSAAAPALAGRLQALLSGYDRCVDLMADQPPTLVHGAYKPRHILVDAGAKPLGICPVDWELAAAGSGLYDLAFLAYGFDPPALDRLLDAYRRAAAAHGVPLPEPERMRRVVDCFRLHRALKALGRAEERALPESKVARMVESCERLAALAG
jgi:aminoglycoside phosphotransferase (APT) family kinase protein